MKIQFGEHIYNLVHDVVADAVNFRAEILKEDNNMADVAVAVSGVSQINVTDDEGSIIKVYSGYVNLITLSLYKNYPVGAETDTVISIELQNSNLQDQINALYSQVETQGAEIADIEEAVDDLAESQETQDLAIEDLAEAVSDLAPEEE